MALMPCHAFFQFYVAEGRLSCQLYQRSADIFLGVPFNIASYALLTHMLAQQCDLQVGDFIWTGGDCHIYDNHVEQVQTAAVARAAAYPNWCIKRRPASIFDYEFEDCTADAAHPRLRRRGRSRQPGRRGRLGPGGVGQAGAGARAAAPVHRPGGGGRRRVR
jgi:thymidylate synthase